MIEHHMHSCKCIHTHKTTNYNLKIKYKMTIKQRKNSKNGNNKIGFRGYKPPIAMALAITIVGSFELGYIVLYQFLYLEPHP